MLLPPGYPGDDFYAEAFTDAAIRRRWAACGADPACAAPVMKAARRFVQPEERDTGVVDPFGRIDPEGEVDLGPDPANGSGKNAGFRAL